MLALMALQTAWAGIPVFCKDGDDESAITLAATASGQEPGELEAIPIGRAVAGEPRYYGQASMAQCSGQPSTLVDIQATLARAEAAFSYRQDTDALGELDRADAALGCLREPLDATLASKVFFLRGVILDASGGQGARTAFADALVFAPDLIWDARYAPDAKSMFQDVRYARKPTESLLRIVPTGVTRGPWLDGRALTKPAEAVSGGRHLVQVAVGDAITSAWVTVDAGAKATLVFPQAFGAEPFDQLSDPVHQPGVAWLLRSAVPDPWVAYAVWEHGVWSIEFSADGATITELRPPSVRVATPTTPAAVPNPTSAAPATAKTPTKTTATLEKTATAKTTSASSAETKSWTAPVRWTGAGLSGVGLVWTTVSYIVAKGAYHDACPTTACLNDPVTYDEAAVRYGSARTQVIVGEAILGTGLVTLGTGITADLATGGPVIFQLKGSF